MRQVRAARGRRAGAPEVIDRLQEDVHASWRGKGKRQLPEHGVRRFARLVRGPDPTQEVEDRVYRPWVLACRLLPLSTYYCRHKDKMVQLLMSYRSHAMA